MSIDTYAVLLQLEIWLNTAKNRIRDQALVKKHLLKTAPMLIDVMAGRDDLSRHCLSLKTKVRDMGSGVG